jgi:hypothetical protein
MNAETRIPPGEEKVDAVRGDEFAVSKNSEDFVPEEELGLLGVERREWEATSRRRGRGRE